MRLGCVAGVDVAGTCTLGAGTTAGPARRAGDAGAGAPSAPSGPGPPGAAPGGAAAGDCTGGVPVLPALVRAIVFGACPLATPLALACVAKFISHTALLVLLRSICFGIVLPQVSNQPT